MIASVAVFTLARINISLPSVENEHLLLLSLLIFGLMKQPAEVNAAANRVQVGAFIWQFIEAGC